MNFNLTGDVNAKLNYHSGTFTRSYLEARAKYDAQIRNWKIEFKDNLFLVEDSNKIIEKVYYDFQIANCSCNDFVETQCGTCMHIEAVLMCNLYSLQINKIRPIQYLDDNCNLKTSLGIGEIYNSPSIETFLKFKDKFQLPKNQITISDFDVFKDYNISLFDFQKESIKLMLENVRSILTLKMGLGKTLCALACVKILDNLQKIIIVAPNSLKYQWQNEINRFQLGSSIVISKRADISKYKDQRFLITSYEMLNFNRELLFADYDILIADEVQKIKNKESATWKSLSRIKTNFIFALSGTPIQNNINDLLSIISFLNPYELKPDWKFYEEFCNCTKARILGIKQNAAGKLRDKLNRYLINPKIDKTQFKLPDKNEIIISTQLTPQQQDIHDNYLGLAKILIAKSMDYPLTFTEQLQLNGLLTKARMAATDSRLFNPDAEKSEKLQKIEQKILEASLQKKKIIVYSQWIKVLNLLHNFLNENKIAFVEFNGLLDAKKRNKHLNQFLQNPETYVFLSTDTGGLGVDGLQLVSSTVIHAEKIWNPMKIEQRNGRLVRHLQKESIVDVYHYVTNSGIEKMMSENHIRKFDTINEMLG